MAFVEDLAPMFADFAVSATVGASSVVGIFDNGYAGAFSGMVPDTDPRFTCATAEASAAGAVVGASMIIGGATYTVCAVEPDGTGITVLRLK